MGGWGDVAPDWLKDDAEKGAALVGRGLDVGSDAAADGLEKIGAPKSAANWVRDKGDSAASAFGAQAAEAQLGETDDPRKLIHGSVDTLRSNARHLKNFRTAFENVARGLKGLDSHHVRGEAADAFREKVSVQPGKWHKAADACEKAAAALEDFAGTVSWAQGQAREALHKYKKAKAVSDKHHVEVVAYNDAVDSGMSGAQLPDKPGESDPGSSGMAEAQHMLSEARRQRDEAAHRARSAVRAARDAAPDRPSMTTRLASVGTTQMLGASHLAGGLVKGTAELAGFARGLNPQDPYNITHRGEWAMHLSSTATGLVRMNNNPVGAGKALLDQGKKDPFEFTGKLVPQFVGPKGLGFAREAGAAAREAGAARGLAEGRLRGEKPPGRGQLEESGPHQHDTPSRERESGGTDPVDLATGRMFLPQTDAVLPGALPLVFRRRVESGYRAGRWFGPSWSSTVDQRLEIDAKGVVFVDEDGLLLAYPHPAPGVPTLPASGPRRRLERTVQGDYTVNDPATGRTWYFTGPEGGGDGEALLEEIADRNGQRITFEYDPDGVPLRLVHSAGYRLELACAQGRVTALSLAGAAGDGGDQLLVRYGYDRDGNLAEVTGSSGLPLRFTYDDQRRVTSWTDTNDRRYDYRYDEQHRCVAEGGTGGHLAVTIDYDTVDEATGHRVTTVTNSRGHTTRYLIDRRYKVVAVTDPLGHTVRTPRDAQGRVTSHTDALGHTTVYAYDAEGRLTTVTRPDGHSSAVAYNDLGLPASVTAPDGTRWRYDYDERGNRTAVTDPAGHTTHYGYDTAGQLTSVTDALGAVTQVRCDAAGLPVEITDPLGATTRYTRDAFGRPTAITDPLGATTRLEWTVEGKLASRTSPDGSTESWTYDGEGNCTRHTDPAGGETRFEYTHFDLLAAKTGPDGVRYTFDHDAELRLTRVTNPQGLTWDYTYDPAGRLISESDFDDRTVTYDHDPAGRVTSRTTAAGDVVRYDRDALGRLVCKDAAGTVTSYTYDPMGNLTEAANPDATVVIDRDALGRPVSESVNGRSLTRRYDELGRPTSRTTPTGAIRTWTYDAAGNPTELTTAGRTLTFTHDEAGRELTRTVGDSLTLTSTYDPLGRLTGQDVRDPADHRIQSRAYTYRPDGHLTAIDDELNGPRSFSLDPTGRVTTVQAADWSETYAYDTVGNLTQAHWPEAMPGQAAVGERSYTGTRIRTAGTVRYEHDAVGRITLRQKTRLSRKPDTWRYEWDAEDHLRRVTTPDGTVWRYRYDPLGRRISKQRVAADGAADGDGPQQVLEQVDFTWDGTTLAEETTSAPATTAPRIVLTWDHDGLHPLTQTERKLPPTPRTLAELASADQDEIDSRFFAIVTDLVGTPRELVDEAGDIAWRTRTTLWGTTAWHRDATAYTPLRFPGQYFDPETGLHYNHFRHYDPETARYLTPDPLGLAPAPNPATYVHNPHVRVDPTGLAPSECPGEHHSGAQGQLRHDSWTHGTSIFRNVDGTEFDAISRTGRFETGPGQMEGKWFATEGAHADRWGEVLNRGEGLTVTTNIPRALADRLHYHPGKLDGIGPGYYADEQQLRQINKWMDGIRLWE